jgi:hypothetical protein
MPERAALVDLYTSTNGDGWRYQNWPIENWPIQEYLNWLTSAHPCTWSGVTCVREEELNDIYEGPVVYLSLMGNGLMGPLPDSIGAMTSLKYVSQQSCH